MKLLIILLLIFKISISQSVDSVFATNLNVTTCEYLEKIDTFNIRITVADTSLQIAPLFNIKAILVNKRWMYCRTIRHAWESQSIGRTEQEYFTADMKPLDKKYLIIRYHL